VIAEKKDENRKEKIENRPQNKRRIEQRRGSPAKPGGPEGRRYIQGEKRERADTRVRPYKSQLR
jgi:hypothetical protein